MPGCARRHGGLQHPCNDRSDRRRRRHAGRHLAGAEQQTNRYLVGPGYRDHVKYWVPFNGDFGFHDASWQTMAFGSPLYPSLGSHGCVHLPAAAMSWLYDWAHVGATVTVHK